MTDFETLKVELGARSYDILVGSELLRQAGALIAPVIRSKRVIIVTDENVAPLYLAPLEKSLKAAGLKSESILLPAGEQTKSFGHFESLIDQILAKKLTEK